MWRRLQASHALPSTNFPSRQALLDHLAELAVTDAGTRLASARIEEVKPDDGVTRAVRALVDVGDYFIALARERIRPAPEESRKMSPGPFDGFSSEGRRAGTSGPMSPAHG